MIELQGHKSNSTRTHGLEGMQYPVMSAQNTPEVQGSLYCSAYARYFEPYKLAVNKLLSPLVGKVK
jgi:hypothetical protein